MIKAKKESQKAKRVESSRLSRAEKKLKVIHLSRSGCSIQKISREVGVSRKTIYEWLNRSPRELSQIHRGRRIRLDSLLFSQFVELLVLARRRKIPDLQKALEQVFGVTLTRPQIRRRLQIWGLDHYRPTAAEASLRRIDERAP